MRGGASEEVAIGEIYRLYHFFMIAARQPEPVTKMSSDWQ
jgi:hypothetical protein